MENQQFGNLQLGDKFTVNQCRRPEEGVEPIVENESRRFGRRDRGVLRSTARPGGTWKRRRNGSEKIE